MTKEQRYKSLIEAIFASARNQDITFRMFADEVIVTKGGKHCHLDGWRSFDEQVSIAVRFLNEESTPG